MSGQRFLSFASLLAVVLVTAAAMIRSDLQRMEHLLARQVAYTEIHRSAVQRMDRYEETLAECRAWLDEDDSGFELWEYHGEGFLEVTQKEMER